MTSQSYAALWNELYDAEYAGDLDETEYFTLDAKSNRTLAKYPELDGLRICEINQPDIESMDEIPKGVDVLVVYAFNEGDDQEAFIPEGTRVVIFLNGYMTSPPALPASVEMAIFDACNEMNEIVGLPDTLLYLIIRMSTEGDYLGDVPIELPASLRYLDVDRIVDFHIRGPMPQGLREVKLSAMRHVRADEGLPTSLRKMTYHAFEKGLFDLGNESLDGTNNLELSCDGELEMLVIKNEVLHVAGYPVTNLEEYHEICDRLPQ